MRELLVLILLFCSCVPSEKKHRQKVTKKSECISSLDKDLFWKENVVPFIKRDYHKMLEITENPLGGEWGIVMEFKKHEDDWTNKEFVDNYERFFTKEIITELKNMKSTSLEINDNEIVVPIGVVIIEEGERYEFAMFLRFHCKNDNWKLYAVNFAG